MDHRPRPVSSKLGHDELAAALDRIAQLEAALAAARDVIERLQRDLQVEARLRRRRER